MSTLGDGEEDMFGLPDTSDALIDAVLNNEAVSTGDAALGVLLTEFAMIADSAAPRPSAALADVLSGTVALAPAGAVPAGRRRRRKVAARAAGVGMATKVWLGAVAASAALTTAVGVSHDLPGPAQRIFEDVVNGATPWTVTHEHGSKPPSAPEHPPGGSASAPGRPPSTPPGLSTYPPRRSSVPGTPPVTTGRPTSTTQSPTHPAPPSHPRSTPPSASHSRSPAPPAPPSSPNQH